MIIQQSELNAIELYIKMVKFISCTFYHKKQLHNFNNKIVIFYFDWSYVKCRD